jgi:hypothetical protein
MTKYVLWKHSLLGSEMHLLHDNATLNEHDIRLGIAPPEKISKEHEELNYDELKKLYPCPEPAPIPKAKRQD